MHGKAVNTELQPTRTINSILTSTPLGKAFASVTTDESNRIGKLSNAAYMLANEEMPFTKYPAGYTALEYDYAQCEFSNWSDRGLCKPL